MFDLLKIAIDSATSSGAKYSDARILISKSRSIAAKNGEVENFNESEKIGLGIRALVGSSWGFYSTYDLSTESLILSGKKAFDIAKAASCEVTGITLSENQFNYCNQKAKDLNLENQVKFKLMDYRELNEKFDRIVSVGMFEHVGRKFYKKFFKQIEKLLNEDGVSLIHTIGSVNPPRDPHPWITKYIFPGGYTPSLSEVTTPIEKAGLIVTDIEVLRLHYSHTLRHWKENCIKNKEKIIKMFDERFFRMWEFYLAGCEMAFKWGDQVVYQFQLSKNYSSTPMTRDYIYQ